MYRGPTCELRDVPIPDGCREQRGDDDRSAHGARCLGERADGYVRPDPDPDAGIDGDRLGVSTHGRRPGTLGDGRFIDLRARPRELGAFAWASARDSLVASAELGGERVAGRDASGPDIRYRSRPRARARP